MPRVNPTVYANQPSWGDRLARAGAGVEGMFKGMATIEQGKIDAQKAAEQKKRDEQYALISSMSFQMLDPSTQTTTQSFERSGGSLPAPLPGQDLTTLNPLQAADSGMFPKPNLGGGGNLLSPGTPPMGMAPPPEPSPAAAMQPMGMAPPAMQPTPPTQQPQGGTNALGQFGSFGKYSKVMEDIMAGHKELQKAPKEEADRIMKAWGSYVQGAIVTGHQDDIKNKWEAVFKPRLERLADEQKLNKDVLNNGFNGVVSLLRADTMADSAKYGVNRRAENKPTPVLPGQKSMDQLFGRDWADYKAMGGFSKVKNNLENLERVAKMLDTSDNLTGPVIGSTGKVIRTRLYPDSIAAEEDVRRSINETLRQIMGSQFTENEGEKLMRLAFNPALEEKENARRVRNQIADLKRRAEAKDEAGTYFDEHDGTLGGWGKPTDWMRTGSESVINSEKNPKIESYAQKSGLSYQQAEKVLKDRGAIP